MSNKRFKPLVDKLYLLMLIPTALIMLTVNALLIFYPTTLGLFIIIPTDLLVVYFLVSPLFGYVELGENSMLIKYGFFLKREIPYVKIRSLEKVSKFYSESMMSLKNAFEHVDIRYNTFDVTSVSVVGNDELISELEMILKP